MQAAQCFIWSIANICPGHCRQRTNSVVNVSCCNSQAKYADHASLLPQAISSFPMLAPLFLTFLASTKWPCASFSCAKYSRLTAASNLALAKAAETSGSGTDKKNQQMYRACGMIKRVSSNYRGPCPMPPNSASSLTLKAFFKACSAASKLWVCK